MNRPKVKPQTGKRGVLRADTVVTDELGWLFREQPASDFGIDAHLEIVEGGEATGRLIAIQIKAGKHWFKEESDKGFVFRGAMEHLNYWQHHSLPVILVLCDLDSGTNYWAHITSETADVTGKGWKILVPKSQVLGRNSRQQLEEIAENKSPYERRLQTLALARPWMDAIQNGDRLILESAEWINKLSGRGSLTLKIMDGWTTKEKVVLDWPLVFLGGSPYERVFPVLFPWAEFSVDEDLYESYDEADFLTEWGIWDSEEQELVPMADFGEWRERLPKIRPYTCEAGEVDQYRLILELNDLGEAFLKVDDYLQTGQVPVANENDSDTAVETESGAEENDTQGAFSLWDDI